MGGKYDFKRSFYYEAEQSVERSKVTFLLGPRKCGKTVCMEQLADHFGNAHYYDLKRMDEDAGVDLRDEIIDSIRRNEKKIYLVDEATYFLFPEKTIAAIAAEFSACGPSNTRVVFAGSQSVALEAWACRAFAGNAMFVYADFLSYPEWLAYKGITEVSEETYNQFISGTREFYSDFISLDAYLKGCLEETIVSNHKTSNIIFHNDCDALDVQTLKNILYAALIELSDRPSLQNFFDREVLLKKIRFSLKEAYRAAGSDIVRNRIDDIFSKRIKAYSSTDFETLKQGYVFLQKCGIVTLICVSSETQNFENIIDVPKDLCRWDKNRINNKNDLFGRVNICIRYPMFYVEILKEVLKEHMPLQITGSILGEIVECHTRGILPQECSYEYHKRIGSEEHEVDYVNYAQQKAVEISVRNKSAGELSFSDLPAGFRKVLLTKDQSYTDRDGVVRIPYYRFIFDHSEGNELFVKQGHGLYCAKQPEPDQQEVRSCGTSDSAPDMKEDERD